MQSRFIQWGRLKSVIVITAVSILISMIITAFIITISIKLGVQANFFRALVIGTIVPMLVAPIVSWSTIGLILKIHALEQEMRHLATYDTLTGLTSRHSFITQSTLLITQAQRHKQPLTLVIIDLDKFKDINDTYGHPSGDKILTTFASIVKDNLRNSDLAGRIGGDEFALCLAQTTPDDAKLLLQRLQEKINAVVIPHDHGSITFTVSIGIASCSEESTYESLVAEADQALYSAKKDGRNKIHDGKKEKE